MNKSIKKGNKRALFLILYAGIIFIIFIYIIFFAPQEFFSHKSKDSEPTSKSLEEMKEKLIENNYEYKINVLNRVGTLYKCKGKRKGEKEEGTCSSPQNITYTEHSKKETFKEINASYLEADYIFELISEIEPTVKDYQATKMYTYTLFLDAVNTEIVLITDKDYIIEIRLSNLYDAYNLSYNFIED